MRLRAFDLNEQARKEVADAGGTEANNLIRM